MDLPQSPLQGYAVQKKWVDGQLRLFQRVHGRTYFFWKKDGISYTSCRYRGTTFFQDNGTDFIFHSLSYAQDPSKIMDVYGDRFSIEKMCSASVNDPYHMDEVAYDFLVENGLLFVLDKNITESGYSYLDLYSNYTEKSKFFAIILQQTVFFGISTTTSTEEWDDDGRTYSDDLSVEIFGLSCRKSDLPSWVTLDSPRVERFLNAYKLSSIAMLHRDPGSFLSLLCDDIYRMLVPMIATG